MSREIVEDASTKVERDEICPADMVSVKMEDYDDDELALPSAVTPPHSLDEMSDEEAAEGPVNLTSKQDVQDILVHVAKISPEQNNPPPSVATPTRKRSTKAVLSDHGPGSSCSACKVVFATLDELNAHTTQCEGRRKDVKPPVKKRNRKICEVCQASFLRISDLKIHKRGHTGERPFKCTSCESAFKSKTELKLHNRIHTGEKPYVCDVCQLAFARSSQLTCHKRTHTGERPYVCEICGARFVESGNLKVHKRTHTGERPYKCDICEAAFVSSSSMKTHRKRHTNERPFVCDMCGATFARNEHLTIHRSTHTGDRPHSCEFCGARFAVFWNLRSHVRKKHNNEGS